MLPDMASKTLVILEDDTDGSEAVETISFALDQITYEIGLSAGNAARLREAFAPYVEKARPSGNGSNPPARRTRKPTMSAPSPAGVRAWANAQGIAVSSRGRISAEVLRKYQEAGN